MRSPLDGGFEVGKASGIWPPQASAIPGFATARLWGQERSHSSTGTSADVSRFARKSFGGISGGPAVTKPLPGKYKLAENARQTCQGPRFGRRAIGFATTTLPSGPGRRREYHDADQQTHP